MALSGTLKDFGLPDIFQLIGLQRKTGVLTLQTDREVVNVVFEEGKVVHADSTIHRLDDLLGTVLVRQGRLTHEKLKQALSRQKVSMQRLGFILTNQGFIESEDLGKALSEQVQQIVFRVFRWKQGTYNFEQAEVVDYDREYVTPVSTDHILMEGIRQVDEWPIIEKRITSMSMVFQRLVSVDQMKIGDTSDGGGGEGFDNSDGKTSASEVTLSANEGSIYRLLDGNNSVNDVVAKTGLSDFDVCRCLFDLIDRNLIAVSGSQQTASRARVVGPVHVSPPTNKVGWAAIVLLSLVGLFLSVRTPFRVPLRPSISVTEARFLQNSADEARLRRVLTALKAFRFAFGTFPPSLNELVTASPALLNPEDLLDGSGRAFDYQFDGAMAVIRALDDSGQMRLEHSLTGSGQHSSLNPSGSVGSTVR